MHIRLCMIVRNESAIIERCLAAVLPHVQSVLIVDTGSTDDTREKIIADCTDRGIFFDLRQSDWKDHARNRTEAFHWACTSEIGENDYGRPDFIFWLDAKDVVVSWPKEILPTQFGYNAMIRFGTLEYDRPALLRPLTGFKWSQGVHEALTYDNQAKWYPQLHDLVIEPKGDQASSFDPGKFQKQVQILQEEYVNTQSTRAAYYLAQAHRDAGNLQDAYAWYRTRVGLVHGWIEETWSAQLEAGKVAERLQLPFDEVLGNYLKAYQLRPTRAESLYHAARYCRLQGKFAVARIFAEVAAQTPRPDDSLFIEFAVYGWLAKEEAALDAWFSGDQVAGQKWLLTIDISKITIDSEKKRLEHNWRSMDVENALVSLK